MGRLNAGVGCVCALLAFGCPSATTQPALSNAGTPSGVADVVPTAVDSLEVGDTVDVKIYGEPDLSGQHVVRSDGTIGLPLVGRLVVKGLNPDAAAEVIRRAYSNGYLSNPEVIVTPGSQNSKRFYVLGAVGRPGAFPYDPQMNILRAVILAGGFGASAAKNRVLVTRTVNGVEVRFEIPVDDIGQGREKNVPILPGDIVYVPTSLL